MLTIVTINLNDAAGLDHTLRSIGSQSALSQVQVVIVDGASTDSSPDVIARHGPALRATVVAEGDRGIYDAMNKGLERATGEYTLWLNAGDYLVDCEVVADFLEHVACQRGRRTVVMGDIIEESHGDNSPTLSPYTFSRHLLGLSMHRHPASFVPTGLAQAVGGYSEEYGFAGDYHFMLRVSFAVGVEEWHRTCTVFTAGGVSHVNVARTPPILARIRRDLLRPPPWLGLLMRAYDRVFALNHRRHLWRRGVRG